MRYQLTIFDFDGTLADTFSWFIRQLDGVADHFGIARVDHAEIESFRGQSARQLVERLGIPTWKLPLIARHMRRLARHDNNHVRLFAGVEQVLECLAQRGVTLAIVSSNAEQVVRRTLGAAAARHVEHFACGASLFGKAGMFRKVLRRAGMAREETICIGDEIRDAEAARSEGLAFGAVAWGFNHAEALRAQKPDAFFDRIEDIPAIVAPSAQRISLDDGKGPVVAMREPGFRGPPRPAI
jgi:phosphoglycolate phosphatase